MKGLSLLEMAGMGPESVVNSVLIWRPMLALDKDSVYDYAHTFGVDAHYV